MATDDKAIYHFITKTNELENSNYWKYLQNTNLSVNIQWRSGIASSQRIGPGEEETKAFILTLRLFCQDNDLISLRNMKKKIDSLTIDQQLKNEFLDIRDGLNDFLDNFNLIPIITIDEHTPSNREIFNAFMYGKYAHITQHETIESWEKLVSYNGMRAKFDQILREYVAALIALRDVCKKILVDLDEKKVE
ncbi:hypothetical protein Pan241w_27840 [Gimesia alba]|uniref:Uncharacterized protein n=1 Tax=Gimesia alba TaxID=2527973 RepID=A0A517RFN7_9PLAN|nr:hypothetical protein [Gimesia alba]QDT42696.1 hypothetical protein Pan241w_27840 [Gimesia alba]